MSHHGPLAGIILAGGEGDRLRAFVRALVGEERPKQFCPVLGNETLLDQTRRRAALAIEPGRLVTVVTAAHERFYRPALAGVADETILVQPAGRGTVPAILFALHRLAALGHTGPVVILPSDHYVSDDHAFMAAVASAVDATHRHPDRVVLLGMPPTRPEVEYGWIEPGPRLSGSASGAVYGVRAFREKPSRSVSEDLRALGALWNSFVLVAEHPAFVRLIATAAPALARAFEPLAAVAGTADEARIARAAYAASPAVDFSREVLQRAPSALAVMRVRDVDWNDLGDPERVRATRRQREWSAVTA